MRSTRSSLNYLVSLYRALQDWELVLAAYNTGIGTIQRAQQLNQQRGKPTDYWDLDLSEQTEDYVPKLLALAEIIRHPDYYGIHLPNVPDVPYFGVVWIQSQMDFGTMSTLSGSSIPFLRHLNPGLQRWATDPDKPAYPLLLPADRVDIFRHNYGTLVGHRYENWQYHAVQSGETITSISRIYHITSQMLRMVNGLNATAELKPGEGLVVPVRLNNTYLALSPSPELHTMEPARLLLNHITLPATTQAEESVPPVQSSPLPEFAKEPKDLKALLQKIYGHTH